ncbi:hypothetical protein L6R52_18390 [Myxococcota bacterium]|nr:hypothetical protein [Myxococcota bacterium]
MTNTLLHTTLFFLVASTLACGTDHAASIDGRQAGIEGIELVDPMLLAEGPIADFTLANGSIYFTVPETSQGCIARSGLHELVPGGASRQLLRACGLLDVGFDGVEIFFMDGNRRTLESYAPTSQTFRTVTARLPAPSRVGDYQLVVEPQPSELVYFTFTSPTPRLAFASKDGGGWDDFASLDPLASIVTRGDERLPDIYAATGDRIAIIAPPPSRGITSELGTVTRPKLLTVFGEQLYFATAETKIATMHVDGGDVEELAKTLDGGIITSIVAGETGVVWAEESTATGEAVLRRMRDARSLPELVAYTKGSVRALTLDGDRLYYVDAAGLQVVDR